MTAERHVGSDEISEAAMRAYRAAKALHRDGGNPASVFGLLAAIVEDRTWEELSDNQGRPFGSFTAFVEGAEPGGLGTTKPELMKLLALRHPAESSEPWDKRAEWLRKTVTGLLAAEVPAAFAVGRPATGNVRATNIKRTDTDEYVTARLKRDDPQLAAKVVAGQVTANAAAHEKGWRKPRVVLANPETVARRIQETFTADQIAQLIALLLPTGEKS